MPNDEALKGVSERSADALLQIVKKPIPCCSFNPLPQARQYFDLACGNGLNESNEETIDL